MRVPLGDEEALRLLEPGTILHWNWDHWVVLADVGATQVHIIDPRVGWRRLTRGELWGAFSGVALLIEP